MDKRKGIIFTLLLLLTAVFIAFVAIMQHNFMNRESVINDSTNTELNSSELENNPQDTANKKIPTDDDEQVDESEEQAITYSNRVVTADLLNVRSGPGPEFEISGIVTLDQEVEVEDDGNQWVKITTEDFTGYVNEKHLSEEE